MYTVRVQLTVLEVEKYRNIIHIKLILIHTSGGRDDPWSGDPSSTQGRQCNFTEFWFSFMYFTYTEPLTILTIWL